MDPEVTSLEALGTAEIVWANFIIYIEAWDKDEEEFGYQRLIASVLASRSQGVHGIRKRVLEDVTAFCKGHFDDDASLIVVAVD